MPVSGTDRYEEVEQRVLRRLNRRQAGGEGSNDDDDEPAVDANEGDEELERRIEKEVLRRFEGLASMASDVIPPRENDGSQPVLATIVDDAEQISGESNTDRNEKDIEGQEGQAASDRTKIYIFDGFVVLLVILVVVMVIVLAGGNGGNENPPESSETLGPTDVPTLAPTTTKMPTKFPTIFPTMIPTKDPTMTPSRFPTLPPTVQPTTILQVFADLVGIEHLDRLSETSPDFLALDWLSYNDPLWDNFLSSSSSGNGTSSDMMNKILTERLFPPLPRAPDL